MKEKIGRNDPCPCGSGKKYKACCLLKARPGKRKFTAAPIASVQQPKHVDLMERTFGDALARIRGAEKTATPPPPKEVTEQDQGPVTL